MKKILIIFVCLITLLNPLCAVDLEYKPYSDAPIWAMNMRRGSSLFFGSLVLTMPLAAIITSALPLTYADEFAKFKTTALIASGLSLGIATTDYIIGIYE